MIRHSVPLETKFAADEAGTIAGYASIFGGEPDAHGDVVRPGAFTDTLARHRQKGTVPVMLWQHDQGQPIGTWTEVREDSIVLAVRGKLVLETRQGSETYVSHPRPSYSPSRSPLLLAREVFRALAGDRNVTDREVFTC